MGNLKKMLLKNTQVEKILGLMEWNLTVGTLSLLLKFLWGGLLQCCLRHPSSSGRICGCFQDDYTLEEGNHSDLPWLWFEFKLLFGEYSSTTVVHHWIGREEGLWRCDISWLESIPWWVCWYQRPSLKLAPIPRIQGRNRYKYQLAKTHSVSLIHWVR